MLNHTDSLPGGIISIVDEGSDAGSGGYFSATYDILFWKSPRYWGRVLTYASTSCLDKCQAEHETLSAFARSECERLAKLAYDRLPGDVMTKPEYEKLCKVLIAAGYDEKLWGDKVNATKALDSYAGPEDFGYPTNSLINRMLPEIEAVDEMAKRADIDCDQPLYDGMSSWTDIIRPFLPSIGGFAEQVDSTIKGYNNLKTLCEVVQASGKCLTDMVFEGIIKSAYNTWNGDNNVDAVEEAFVTNSPYAVKNIPDSYKDMSKEEFYNLMLTKFTAKRSCELSKAELESTKKNRERIITLILYENERNIQKIERSIEAIQKHGIVPEPDLPLIDAQKSTAEDNADDEQEYTTDDSYGSEQESGDSSWQDSWSGLSLSDYAAMNEQGVQ